jgi:hypothetical protein
MNQFPVILPDGRGGQTMFRSGEGTTSQWFSRFVGEKGLSRISYAPVKAKQVQSEKIDSSVNVKNIDQIAQAVAKVLEGKMNVTVNQYPQNLEHLSHQLPQFDDSQSQSRLADAMSVQTEKKDSNLKNFEEVRVKKSKKQTDETLSLLAGLE